MKCYIQTYIHACIHTYIRTYIHTGLWVHVCWRQLTPTADFRSNSIIGDYLGSLKLQKGSGALIHIGNLC